MFIKKSYLTIVLTVFTLLITMFTNQTINSVSVSDLDLSIVENDLLSFNINVKPEENHLIWNLYSKKKSIDTNLSIEILNYTDDLDIIYNNQMIIEDNIIEVANDTLNNQIIIKTNKNFYNLNLKLKLVGLEDEILYLQDFLIDLRDYKQAEEDKIINNKLNLNSSNNNSPFIYTTDDFGQYIQHYIGEETFRNYNYSTKQIDQGNEPEIINAITDGSELNFFNGYHYYPWTKGDTVQSSILTSQIVSESENPGIFDVELDVIGGATEIIEERDIMFVFDKSALMNDKIDNNKTRWDYLTAAIKLFSEKLLVHGNDKIRIGMTSYGTDSKGAWADSAMFSSNKHTFTSHVQNIINHEMIHQDKARPNENSQSPTFLGVKTAVEAINNRPLNEQGRKVMIILITASSSDIMPYDNYETSITSSYNNSKKITSYRLPISNNGYDISTISDKNDLIVEKLVESLKNTTRIAMGIGENDDRASLLKAFSGHDYRENNAYNHLVNSSDDLHVSFEVIKRLASGSTSSFDLGTLENPLSKDVVLISQDIELSAITVNYDYYQNNYYSITEFSKNQQPQYISNIKMDIGYEDELPPIIKLSNINLGSIGNNRMGLRMKYQIKLSDEVELDNFRLINHGEGSKVKAYNYDDSVYFATPSIRKISYTDKTRDVYFNKKSNGENLKGAVFNLYEIINGEKRHLTSSQSDNEGKIEFKYLGKGDYILEEVRMIGFDDLVPIEFSINEDMEIEGLNDKNIENILNPYRLVVNKMDNNEIALAGAKFELCKLADINNYLEVIEEDSIFTFSDLSVGEYILRETIVPDGYVSMKDQTIVINHDASVLINGERYAFNEVSYLEDSPYSLKEEVAENDSKVNVITFDAINIKKGILPSTGSNKMFMYFIIPALLLLTSLGIYKYINRNDSRRRSKQIIVLLIISTTLINSLTSVNAKSKQVKIVIHKSVYTNPDANPEHELNDGLNSIHNEETVRYNNVKFDVYDFSDYIKNSSKDIDLISEEIVNLARDDLISFAQSNGEYLETIKTNNVKGIDGVAETSIEIKEDTAILFIENDTPLFKDKYLLLNKALPMLIVLPIIDLDNPSENLSTINLYPKSYGYRLNEEDQEDLEDDEKDSEEEKVPTGISFNTLGYTLLLVSGLSLILLIKLNRGKNNEKE